MKSEMKSIQQLELEQVEEKHPFPKFAEGGFHDRMDSLKKRIFDELEDASDQQKRKLLCIALKYVIDLCEYEAYGALDANFCLSLSPHAWALIDLVSESSE